MNDVRRAELAAVVDKLDDQYRLGNVPADLYSRSMVILAREYMREGEMRLATDVLRRCPPAYFEGSFGRQMEEDKRFEALAYEVANKLVAERLVEELAAVGIKFTQPGVGRA